MVFWGIASGVFALDTMIKEKIERPSHIQVMSTCARDGMAAGVRPIEVHQGEEEKVIASKILIRRSHNEGVAMNRLEKHPSVVTAISCFLTGIVAILLGKRKKGESPVYHLGLALLLGGALSNSADRLFRGYVVDYFSFITKNQKINRIVFNLSDFFIVIGSLLAGLFRK